jgi:hypothetical protein
VFAGASAIEQTWVARADALAISRDPKKFEAGNFGSELLGGPESSDPNFAGPESSDPNFPLEQGELLGPGSWDPAFPVSREVRIRTFWCRKVRIRTFWVKKKRRSTHTQHLEGCGTANRRHPAPLPPVIHWKNLLVVVSSYQPWRAQLQNTKTIVLLKISSCEENKNQILRQPFFQGPGESPGTLGP